MADLETAPKPFVFVLMPFSPDFTDVYEVGIKQACKDAGAYCERVDEQFYDTTILERIYNQIAKADIIVSDMTGRNPNVFYETGYAHALKKQVILLTQKSEDIPFDLKSFPHIVYEGKLTNLKERLSKRIEWIVQNPSERLSRVELNLAFYIDRTEVHKENTRRFILKSTGKNLSGIQSTLQLYELKIDIYNPTQRMYREGNCSLAIITSSNFPRSTNTASTSPIPGGSYFHVLHPIPTIFPGVWTSVSLQFGAIQAFTTDSFIIRLFTELESQDFTIEVQPER
jgi:hypothetical protein